MNLNAKIEPLTILDLMKGLNGSDYSKGVHKNSKIMIKCLVRFRKYLEIYEN